MQLSTGTVGIRNRGFSLVEVLVALIVICVGLLGVAKMQALALSSMTTSRMRALAAFEAAGLAAEMHSNQAYWTVQPTNFAPGYNIVVNPLATPVIASSDGALSAQASADYLAGNAGNGATGLNACVGSAAGLPECSNYTNLAAYDLARWATSLKGLLPNPTATIRCPVVAVNEPVSCTIQITWSEKAVGVTQQETTVSAAACTAQGGGAAGFCFENPTYLVYVEP
jgi:type IV pilus assembly protein PilV